MSASRMVVEAASHRFVNPVYVVAEGDSSEIILDGFTEGLLEAGITPHVGSSDGATGTLIRVRAGSSDSTETIAFDVRVDRLPERTVVYSRVLVPGTSDVSTDNDGILERLVVPVAAVSAAVLVIYLLFTVRS